jgi:uncharacterized protein YjcR
MGHVKEFDITPAPKAVPSSLFPNLKQRHWDAFMLYTQGVMSKEIAKRVGVSAETVSVWKGKEWWKELVDYFFAVRQRDIQVQMAKDAQELYEGYRDVVTGVDKNDRTANARVKGFELLLTAGKNPILTKNPNVLIDNSKKIENRQVVNITPEQLSQLSQEEMMEVSLSGVIPERIKQINPVEGAVDEKEKDSKEIERD